MTAMLELLAGERQSNESNNALIACNDYLRMGVKRSLANLCRRYAEQGLEKPPTKHLNTLKLWSVKYSWVNRSTEYDATWEQRKNEKRAAELEDGLALDYERIGKLKRLAKFLEGQLYEQGEHGDYHNVWLPDVKQIGSGQDAERIDLEKFNAPLIQQYRDVLGDLAKETGGRPNKQEVSAPGGGPVEHKVTLGWDDGSHGNFNES